ncbi:MAG: hypothetical protein ABIM89_08725 [Mycobacteriales bacterium]
MSRFRDTGDDGSVLVMALVFLSLFGLAIAAALGFATTGFKTALGVHSTTRSQYTADAAIDGAINKIRSDVAIGTEAYGSNTCFSMTSGDVNATAVDVTCKGRVGSGVAGAGAGGGTAPPNAVLTFPTNASEGIVVGAAATPVITGNATTGQSKTVGAGATLTVQGALTCKTVSGTGSTVATTTTACPTASPVAADPLYPAEVTYRPAPAAAPICPAAATVTFLPGTYTSAAALNQLTGGSCTGKRFHFTPGTYYFEFADPLPSGTHQWLINDATAEVVGGTLTAPATAFPSRCDLASAGVQFIFGSDSRVALTAGSLELCPPISATQRIAIYGAKTTPPTTTTTTTLTPTTATSTAVGAEPNTYVTPTNGRLIDGVETRWVASTNKGQGSLTLLGFSTTAIPANAKIDSATLRVASRYENEWLASNAPQVILTPGDGSAPVGWAASPCPFATCTAGTTVSQLVTSQINTPARANGISMQYAVQDKQGIPYFVSYVDGVSLDITWHVEGLVGTDTPVAGFTGPVCTVAAPYSPTTVTTTCPVLRGTGTATAKMAIKGTIYAPLGAVDLSMTGQLNSVAQRGVVARTLQLGLTRGAGYTGSLINLPGSGQRYVLLTANIGGAATLRADVTIDDAFGVTPGATVTVTSWSVLR